jgi:hypothetical protein
MEAKYTPKCGLIFFLNTLHRIPEEGTLPGLVAETQIQN